MSSAPNNPFFGTVPGDPDAVVDIDLAAYTERIGMSREAVFAWIRHLESQGYVETRTAPREAGAAGGFQFRLKPREINLAARAAGLTIDGFLDDNRARWRRGNLH